MTVAIALLAFTLLTFLLVCRVLKACQRHNSKVRDRQHRRHKLACSKIGQKRVEMRPEGSSLLVPARQV